MNLIRGSFLWMICLCVAVPLLAGCGAKEEAIEDVVRPVKTITVEEAVSGASRKLPGVVQASRVVELAFRVSGRLSELNVRDGQEAGVGDVLAQLDPRDFQTRAASVESQLDEAQAQLKAMRAGGRAETIRVLEARVSAAEARHKEAGQHNDRQKELFAEDLGTQAQLEQSEAARDVAHADLAAARETLEEARRGARPEEIEAQESRVKGLNARLKEARSSLEDTTLRAPFSGIVAARYVENFEEVRAGFPIVSLQDISTIEVIAQVPERAVANSAGAASQLEISVTFTSLPGRTFPASYKSIAAEADPETQTYTVTVTMPQPEGVNIYSGMTAEITFEGDIPGEAAPTGILLPSHAVFEAQDGRRCVWVVDLDTWRVSRREVVVLRLTGDSIQISEGLEPGETIATAGVHYLREGMKVRPLSGAAGGRTP